MHLLFPSNPKCFPKEGNKLPTVGFYMVNFEHKRLKLVYKEENSKLLEISFSRRLLADATHTLVQFIFYC